MTEKKRDDEAFGPFMPPAGEFVNSRKKISRAVLLSSVMPWRWSFSMRSHQKSSKGFSLSASAANSSAAPWMSRAKELRCHGP